MRDVTDGLLLEQEQGAPIRATLIREGVSKNGHNWTRPVIEKLASVVNGVPVNFYDMSPAGDGSHLAHWEQLRASMPPAIAAQLPERLPSAQIGTIQNASVHVDEKGIASVVGDVATEANASWFRPMLERIKASKRTLGVSIHVPPDGMVAERLHTGGLQPSDVSRVVGFDVVSFPSAGGAFESVLEALNFSEGQRLEKVYSKLLTVLLRHVPSADKRKALTEGLKHASVNDDCSPEFLLQQEAAFCAGVFEACRVDVEDGDKAAMLRYLYRTAPDAAPVAVERPATVTESRKADEGGKSELDALKAEFEGLKRLQSVGVIEAAIADSKLPPKFRTLANQQLRAMLESGATVTADTAKAHVAQMLEAVGDASSESSLVESKSSGVTYGAYQSGDRAVAAFDAMLEGREFGKVGDEAVPAMRGLREAWGVMTGDVLCEGEQFFLRDRRQSGALESFDMSGNTYLRQMQMANRGLLEADIASNVAAFAALLADRTHKRMVREYQSLAHIWRMISQTESVPDFKAWRILRGQEYNNLSAVAENSDYASNDLNPATQDEEVTLTVAKYGGTVDITWETIKNDDLGFFKRIPSKLARAAERTLNEFVWSKVVGTGAGDTDMFDGNPLFDDTNHGNLQAVAYSATAMRTARKKMTQQQDISSKEAGRATARHVFCGPEQIDAVYADMFTDGKPDLTITNDGTPATDGYPATQAVENAAKANVLRSRYGLQLHELHYFDQTSDADRVILTADPSEIEMVSVAFLDGKQSPELFLSDLERVGSFFSHDRMTYKIRHVYDAAVVDWRGFQGIVPT